MDATILEKLQVIFREMFDDEQISLSASTTADDIEDWNSLSNIELMVAIEQEFGITFNLTQIADLQNVGELVDVIASLL